MVASTITSQINMGKNLEITNSAFREKTLVKADNDTYIILNLGTMVSKYWPQLKNNSYVYQLSDLEILKYEYRPTLFSYDLYGTVELAPFILQLNHMVSEADFSGFTRLRVFTRDIYKLLNEILIREESNLRLNQNRLVQDLAATATA
jgi:hypothetical protein